VLLAARRKTDRKGTRKMSLWQAANDIEELSYKLANVRDMVELVAEDVSDPYSGALWAIKDMIENIEDKVAKQADALMELHRADLKKAKKK
jgi:protein-tyrosine-phosphatase